ncbi:MAG: hypothetical protein AABW50_02070 [Nanoarchaeota archaeon]
MTKEEPNINPVQYAILDGLQGKNAYIECDGQPTYIHSRAEIYFGSSGLKNPPLKAVLSLLESNHLKFRRLDYPNATYEISQKGIIAINKHKKDILALLSQSEQ